MNAQAGKGRQSAEPFVRQAVRGQAVGHNADLVPARRQFLGQVPDMPEETAHRRPQDLQDAKRRLGHQSQRSEITIVSPG